MTCPIIRIHPAVVAQAAATTALLFGDRFRFGVGTGEALNEHILGHRWPRAEVRLKMLEEAVTVMRELWKGDTVNFRGDFYEVENARLFDAPGSVPVIVSGFGPAAIECAARIGDGYWGHSPDPSNIEQFTKHGGHGPRYAQINVCWAEDEQSAKETVHRVWPTSGLSGQLMQDLPTWNHFEQAVEIVDVEQASKSTACGPDVGKVLESVKEYVDAGYDHIYFHQIGPDQVGFLRFWERELRDALRELDGDDIDGIIQVGTNLAMARLAASAEIWLKRPVVAINTAIYWNALRSSGITDRVPGFGTLLERH